MCMWVGGDMKQPLLRELQKFFLLFILYGNAHGCASGAKKVIEVPGVKVEDFEELVIFAK